MRLRSASGPAGRLPLPLVLLLLLSALLATGGASALPDAAAVPASAPGGGDPEAASPLPSPGRSIQRPLSGGEVHRYRVSIPPGQFLRVVVQQQGIDVVVRLLGPAGEQLVEGDSPNGRNGPEPLSHVAPAGVAAGPYTVEVASPKPQAAAAGYTLRVEALRPAVADDAKVVRAERLESGAAVDAWVEGTAESRRRAVESYRQARRLWQELGDDERLASVLNNLGFLHSMLGEAEEEAATFRELLELRQALGNDDEIARSRLNLATALLRLGRYDEAEELYRLALEHFEATGDRKRAASVWNGLSTLHWRLGKLELAREDFLRVLESEREQGDLRGQALVLNNLGLVERGLGNTRRADELFQQALDLARRGEDPTNMAAALNNLGVSAENRGHMQEALKYHRQVRDLEQGRGNRSGEAYALHNLGYVYLRLGKLGEAATYFRDALALYRATGQRSAEARSLSSLAAAHLAQEQPDTAQPYVEEALELARELDDRRLESTALTQLGRVEEQRDRFEAALAHLAQALELCRELGLPVEEAEVLIHVGNTRTRQGQSTLAREPLTRALEVFRRTGHRSQEAVALLKLALASRAQGNLEEARLHLEESLRVLEDLRSSVDILELRSTLFAEWREHHEAYVDLLMELHRRHPEQGWDRRAFEAAEQARARSLTDLLREAKVDLRRDADPALVARAVELGRQLSALEHRRLEEREAAPGEPERLEPLVERIGETRKELLWVEAEMRRSSPRYASLTESTPLDLERVQGLLDPGVVLVQYSLGRDRSFLWVATAETFGSWQLPPAEQLEQEARRLYEALRTPGGGSTDLAREVGALLLGPAAERLAAATTVAVVADGALHFIPFPALAVDDDVPYRPLVADHQVVHLPSVAALAMLREREESDPPQLLAVFADPVFQPADRRIHHLAGDEDGDGDTAVAEAGHRSGDDHTLDFRRLRFSRREAEQIAQLVPEDQRLLSFDFQASRDTVENILLDQYRYLHFATHGVLDGRFPELSGLVLSLVDPEGRPVDGFLRLHEIYNLDLDSEVVTLSACRTALGQEIRGEGVVGLTRGFMYAGAERVVASLWDVQDRATAEIMERFYRGMLEQGLRPAEALRRAQVQTWQEARWSDPYFWSPFVLQGDWR